MHATHPNPPRLVRIVGRAVERARSELGMNQVEMADALSELLGYQVHRQRIYDWAAGVRDPDAVALVAIAELVARRTGIEREEAMAFMVREVTPRARTVLPQTSKRSNRRRRAG
jgi:hypothetical protein